MIQASGKGYAIVDYDSLDKVAEQAERYREIGTALVDAIEAKDWALVAGHALRWRETEPPSAEPREAPESGEMDMGGRGE